MVSEAVPENETPSQKQARLRRERRNAKIQAGGADRLAAIMNSSGRQHAAEAEKAARPSTPSSQPQSGTQTPDPEIMDIAEHIYQPRTTDRSSQKQQRQHQQQQQRNPFMAGQQAQQMPPTDDPIMQMMQQMMAGAGGPNGPGFGSGPGSADDPMAAFAQMMGSAGGMPGQPEAQQERSSAYPWQILHFFIALLLSFYVAMFTTFTGSKRARDLSNLTYNAPLSTERNFTTNLFYVFATAQVILQTTRFFMERGQLHQPGILGTLSKVLPMPWAGYVRAAGRYSMIYTTVVADAWVVVFVLGVMAWWRGGAQDLGAPS